MDRPSRAVLLLLGLGLAVRLVALPEPGMVDVKAWKAWSLEAATRGLAAVYGPSDGELLRLARDHGGLGALASMPFPRAFFTYRGEEYYVDYPPGSMLLLWLVGRAYLALDPDQSSGRLFNALLNLLPLVASAAVTWVLRRSATGPEGWQRAVAFWCNPALLLASVLGYQDTVFGAVALLAVVAAMRRRHVLAVALLAGAGLLKPQASLLVPTLAALLFTDSRLKDWLRAGLAGLAVSAAVLAPWWAQGHLLSALDGCRRPLVMDLNLSAQGLNVWWIAGYVVQWLREGAWPLARLLFLDDFNALAGWDPVAVSRVLLLAGTALNLGLLLRRPADDPLKVPLAVILQVHVYGLFGTGVHENHTILALVLAPLLLGAWDNGRTLLALLSTFLFLNLFLFEGLGRGVLRDRQLYRLRLLAGVDLTVLVALAHVALFVILVFWIVRRRRS
ncbi:MAG: hypothetical protein HY317_03760 [Acidobacteria bacterium]|nr:hypothetical protein [Acidobacteriota bacterium]